DERAAVMIAQPLAKFLAGELAVGLGHGPLAVRPAGLDRVQPRALARPAADEEAAPGAGGLDPAIVGHDPGPHLAADVPGGVVPDQGRDPDTLGREPAGRPGEEGAGHGTHRSPGDEPRQHPLALGRPRAVAGERLDLTPGSGWFANGPGHP